MRPFILAFLAAAVIPLVARCDLESRLRSDNGQLFELETFSRSQGANIIKTIKCENDCGPLWCMEQCKNHETCQVRGKRLKFLQLLIECLQAFELNQRWSGNERICKLTTGIKDVETKIADIYRLEKTPTTKNKRVVVKKNGGIIK